MLIKCSMFTGQPSIRMWLSGACEFSWKLLLRVSDVKPYLKSKFWRLMLVSEILAYSL